MRLFAALPLSAEAVERLTRLHLRLSAPGDGLRWSTPEQWHITLQFYGEIEDSRAACLREGLTRLAVDASADVVLDGLGRFGAKGILYASVAVTPTLTRLQQQVVECGGPCGMAPESRLFRPHVTLARSKGRPGMKTLDRLSKSELPAFGPDIRWRAEEIQLIQSTLTPHGSVYSVYSRAELKPQTVPLQEAR